ncbi:MAG: hypothetical protein M5U27_14590 [Gaiella sp.]|nr:hypothetical protein [Gaiella sp.]
MRTLIALVAATGLAAAVGATSTASVSHETRITPGKGIGKVQLGMTLPQVRRAFGGPPLYSVWRNNFGSRGRYIEYVWEVGAMDIRVWKVGFRSTTRNGPLRVLRAGTSVSAQRTPEGLGVGSLPRDIARAYPNVVCEFRSQREKGWYGTWMVVQHPGGGMTAFDLDTSGVAGTETVIKVIEVLVQRSWLNDDDGRVGAKCPEDYVG